MNQEFEADQLALQSRPHAILEPLISLSPEPENPPIQVPLAVDTRLIWPGRIELIYQTYLAEKNTWLAANPTIRPAQYRSKRGLHKWTKAACEDYKLKWLLPQQRLNLESETLIEGPPNWTREEIHAWLDWDKEQDKIVEQQVEAEVVAAGGYGGDSRRGIGHIHRQIEAEDIAERQQYRFR
jgi:hypothetical protein